MAGPYMYLVAAVLVFGFLLAKFLMRLGSSTTTKHRTITITDADVEAAIRGGQKILAVKLYRELHGGDLTQAVAAVEAIIARIQTDA